MSDKRAGSDAPRSEGERALAKLESLLAEAPVGIAFLDRNLAVLRMNAAIATLGELGDPTGHHLRNVLPALAERLEPLMHRILETGEPILDLELQLGERSFLANLFSVRMPPEAIIGIGAVLIEISERKQMENDLRAAIRARDDVLAVVSHDLRSPVSTIRLTSTLLAQTAGPDPRTRKHLEVLQRSVARLQHLLDDLVDSVNIRAGRLSLALARQTAETVMSEAVELQEPLAAERAIQIERDAAVEGLDILCDRHRVLQVFGNLISNALKFCSPGDRIRVTAARGDGEVVFAVHDNGPGIPADLLPSLFHPHRARATQVHTGSGLGLHICKGIVERHGGRIWIESDGDRGTSVYFTVPSVPA